MHPTPDEQLRAVLRRLEQAGAEPGLPPASREAIDDARRLVRRLERTWFHRLPFLALDNRLAIELLGSIAPQLPELSAEIEAAAAEVAAEVEASGTGELTGAASADRPLVDEPFVHDVNKRLQGLLGRAVHLLPDDAEGNAGRSRIAAHLRSRLAADPALNRTPTDRRPPVSDPQEEEPAP